eukprot:2478278-Rhodomonas_salina.1
MMIAQTLPLKSIARANGSGTNCPGIVGARSSRVLVFECGVRLTNQVGLWLRAERSGSTIREVSTGHDVADAPYDIAKSNTCDREHGAECAEKPASCVSFWCVGRDLFQSSLES